MARFNSIKMERPFDTFTNLTQTSIIMTYLNKFEQLKWVLDPLPSKCFLEKFYGGPKEEIRYDVLATKPVDIKEVVS